MFGKGTTGKLQKSTLLVGSFISRAISTVKVKVKQPRYRPGVAQRVPGS